MIQRIEHEQTNAASGLPGGCSVQCSNGLSQLGTNKPAISCEVVIVGRRSGRTDATVPSTMPIGLQAQSSSKCRISPARRQRRRSVAAGLGILGRAATRSLYRRTGAITTVKMQAENLGRMIATSNILSGALRLWGRSHSRGRGSLAVSVITEASANRGICPVRAADFAGIKLPAGAHAVALRSQYPASPTVEYAHYLAAEAAFRQGQFDHAVKDCSTFLQRYPRSVLSDHATLVCAESHYQLGRYPQAQRPESCRRSTTVDP